MKCDPEQPDKITGVYFWLFTRKQNYDGRNRGITCSNPLTYSDWTQWAQAGQLGPGELLPADTDTAEYIGTDYTEWKDTGDSAIVDSTSNPAAPSTEYPDFEEYRRIDGKSYRRQDYKITGTSYLRAESTPITVPNGCPPATATTTYYTCTYENQGAEYWWSPLIVDVYGVGDVHQLAPEGWERGRKGVVDPIRVREFAMTPEQSLKLWEWVSPAAGILLHSEGAPPKEAGWWNVFGSHTWGVDWDNGYLPLSALDTNRDGYLIGSELASVWIWVDGNGDAKIDAGEVAPSASHLERLAVRPDSATVGSPWAAKGARLKDGRWVGSWDWWPKPLLNRPGFPELESSTEQTSPRALYRWKQKDGPQGGYLLFVRGGAEGDVINVLSTSDNQAGDLSGGLSVVRPVDPAVAPNRISWVLEDALSTTAIVLPDGRMRGTSGTGPENHYSWDAVPVTSFDSDFAASVGSVNPSSILFSESASVSIAPVTKEKAEATPPPLVGFRELLALPVTEL